MKKSLATSVAANQHGTDLLAVLILHQSRLSTVRQQLANLQFPFIAIPITMMRHF